MAFGRGRGNGGGRGASRGGASGNRGGGNQAPKQLTERAHGGVNKPSGATRGRGPRPQGRGGRGPPGRGRGRDSGRGGGRGGKVQSQADLDEELDKYMLRDSTYAGKKLDDDLDDYFKTKKSEPEQAAEEQAAE